MVVCKTHHVKTLRDYTCTNSANIGQNVGQLVNYSLVECDAVQLALSIFKVV